MTTVVIFDTYRGIILRYRNVNGVMHEKLLDPLNRDGIFRLQSCGVLLVYI